MFSPTRLFSRPVFQAGKTALLALAWLGLLSGLAALPRELVVVEVVTGTWCQYCPGAAMACHDLLANGHPVAVIKNHTGDSFTNQYSEARNDLYNPTGVPTAWFDGLNANSGGSATQSLYSTYLPRVDARLALPSHFTIGATGSQTGSLVQLAVTVAKPEADSNTNVKLHAVLTESHINFPWQNQSTLENVNRLMLPDQNGTAINLATGGSTTVDLSFAPSSAWQLTNCEMIFFLQNMSSKEILQAVKYPLAELVGYYPLSTNALEFPDTYITSTSTLPLIITNYLDTPVSGTISIDTAAFTGNLTNFNIEGSSSITTEISFAPTAVQDYTGVLTIAGNLQNHPVITVNLSGTGYSNTAPTVTNLVVAGPPVLYQPQSASYEFVDADGNTEGNSTFQWFRIEAGTPLPIANANEEVYRAVGVDLGFPIAVQVTPIDQHGMAGTPVMSPPTLPIEVLPPPQNLQAALLPSAACGTQLGTPGTLRGQGPGRIPPLSRRRQPRLHPGSRHPLLQRRQCACRNPSILGLLALQRPPDALRPLQRGFRDGRGGRGRPAGPRRDRGQRLPQSLHKQRPDQPAKQSRRPDGFHGLQPPRPDCERREINGRPGRNRQLQLGRNRQPGPPAEQRRLPLPDGQRRKSETRPPGPDEITPADQFQSGHCQIHTPDCPSGVFTFEIYLLTSASMAF